jgi:hypothetical protein
MSHTGQPALAQAFGVASEAEIASAVEFFTHGPGDIHHRVALLRIVAAWQVQNGRLEVLVEALEKIVRRVEKDSIVYNLAHAALAAARGETP